MNPFVIILIERTCIPRDSVVACQQVIYCPPTSRNVATPDGIFLTHASSVASLITTVQKLQFSAPQQLLSCHEQIVWRAEEKKGCTEH